MKGKKKMTSPFEYKDGKPNVAKDRNGNATVLRVIEAYYAGELAALIEQMDYVTRDGYAYEVSTKQEADSRILRFATRTKSIIEAKAKLNEMWFNPEKFERVFGGVKSRKTYAKVKLLPETDNGDFYPTPGFLAGKMLGKVDWSKVISILEPSAGKGDLIEAIYKFIEAHRYDNGGRWNRQKPNVRLYCNDQRKTDIDCIEIDYNLRLILRGKDYRLVAEDFLDYEPQKSYSLVLMNPPFSSGAQHLLKAISLQKRTGGQIVCLLNAETILNPYNNIRKELKAELDRLGASIEIVHDAFKKAERKTDVSVAIVYICIDKPKRESKLFEEMKKAQEVRYAKDDIAEDSLVYGDEIDQSIQHFNLEASVGRELIEEYAALSPNILSGGSDPSPLITLKAGDTEIREDRDVESAVNGYLKALRYKYWSRYLDMPKIKERLTSTMRDEWYDKLSAMQDYDYSRHNIAQLNFDMQQQLLSGIQDSIISLFEKLSQEHAYYEDDSCHNIHYYNGWRTNKAWKVNGKCIIPAYGSYKRSVFKETWDDKVTNEIDAYDAARVISDLEKTLNYLNKGEVSGVSIEGALDRAIARESKTVSFTYFDCTFYKKGTAHIKFYPEAQPILDRLNIFAARSRSWLPPSYGRKHYEDMTTEEQSVIDEFQGRDDYENKVMVNPSNYILEASALLQLT